MRLTLCVALLSVWMGVYTHSANAQQQHTFQATHYGESYNGQRMGCANAGAYNSNDVSIVAVGPAYYTIWPCNTELLISGPAGTIVGVRKDSCPDCDRRNMIDLSEAGITAVCGGLGSCTVRVERVEE